VTRAIVVGLVLLPTAAAAGVALAAPDHRARAIAAWMVFAGAVGIAAGLRRVLRARPRGRSAFEAALESRRPAPPRLRFLETVENDCVLGLANPLDLHRRVRPRLREVAAQRLAARYGIDLDRRPDAAEALLGAEAWEVVRPGRPVADEVTGRRLDATGLRRILDRLETL
jgi:hypothetical protein